MRVGENFSGSFLDILNNFITTQIPGPKNTNNNTKARSILKGPSKSIPTIRYYSRGERFDPEVLNLSVLYMYTVNPKISVIFERVVVA